MIRGFSANLGFLWKDLPTPDAIRAAAAAGFDAVEIHAPYDQDRGAVQAALEETGIPLIGVNTRRGFNEGELGLAALPGRETEARALIDEALDWAAALGARHIHALAGRATGPEAEAVFRANMAYACDGAAEAGVTIVLEPLSYGSEADYFLRRVEHAHEIIEALGRSELRLMFDVFHAQKLGGDLVKRLERLMPVIAHVQIAGVPDRGRPDEGEVAVERLLPVLERLGYDGWIGAEYHPEGASEDSLGWMPGFRAMF